MLVTLAEASCGFRERDGRRQRVGVPAWLGALCMCCRPCCCPWPVVSTYTKAHAWGRGTLGEGERGRVQVISAAAHSVVDCSTAAQGKAPQNSCQSDGADCFVLWRATATLISFCAVEGNIALVGIIPVQLCSWHLALGPSVACREQLLLTCVWSAVVA